MSYELKWSVINVAVFGRLNPLDKQINQAHWAQSTDKAKYSDILVILVILVLQCWGSASFGAQCY